jgi:hypothetical protein
LVEQFLKFEKFSPFVVALRGSLMDLVGRSPRQRSTNNLFIVVEAEQHNISPNME